MADGYDWYPEGQKYLDQARLGLKALITQAMAVQQDLSDVAGYAPNAVRERDRRIAALEAEVADLRAGVAALTAERDGYRNALVELRGAFRGEAMTKAIVSALKSVQKDHGRWDAGFSTVKRVSGALLNIVNTVVQAHCGHDAASRLAAEPIGAHGRSGLRERLWAAERRIQELEAERAQERPCPTST